MRAAALVALALVACGGEQGEKPALENGVDCAAVSDLETQMIEDFEVKGYCTLPACATDTSQCPNSGGGDFGVVCTSDADCAGSAPYCRVSNSFTTWYWNNDASAPSDPPRDDVREEAGDKSLSGTPIEGGRCGSQYAFHGSGGPFTLYGGSFGHNTFSPLLDATGWDGIVFWAKRGVGSRSTIRLNLSDVNTDEQGGVCQPDTPKNDPTIRTGCDKYGGYAIVDEVWRPFVIDFVEMRQGGWGLQTSGLDTAGIYSIIFAYQTGYWDLWIDDVALFRRVR